MTARLPKPLILLGSIIAIGAGTVTVLGGLGSLANFVKDWTRPKGILEVNAVFSPVVGFPTMGDAVSSTFVLGNVANAETQYKGLHKGAAGLDEADAFFRSFLLDRYLKDRWFEHLLFMKNYWTIELYNRGGRQVDNVIVKMPRYLDAEVQKDGSTWYLKDSDEPLKLGNILPFEKTTITAWTFNDLRTSGDLVVTDADGVVSCHYAENHSQTERNRLLLVDRLMTSVFAISGVVIGAWIIFELTAKMVEHMRKHAFECAVCA